MATGDGQAGPPRVVAKDLKALQLYAARPAWMHFDNAPFAVCYLCLLLRAVQHLLAGTW